MSQPIRGEYQISQPIRGEYQISQPIRGEYYLISISRSRVKSQWFSFSTCTTPHGYCRARTFLLPT